MSAPTRALIQSLPGLANAPDALVDMYLDLAYKQNTSDCWGNCINDAITFHAAAMTLDALQAASGGTGPLASVSRSMGASGSLSFTAPPDHLNLVSWQRNVWGQQYVELRQRQFQGGAMAIERDGTRGRITTP